MIPAHTPVQRPRDARLLVVDAHRRVTDAPRAKFIVFLKRGDLVIANDAATIPASLTGRHVPSGAEIEVRLAGWSRQSGAGQIAAAADRSSLAATDVHEFTAVVFGAGDFHMRTEDRPPPPSLAACDRLELRALSATVESLLDHPRLILLRFSGSSDHVWAG